MITPVSLRMLPMGFVVWQRNLLLKGKNVFGALGKPKSLVAHVLFCGIFSTLTAFIPAVTLLTCEDAFSEAQQLEAGAPMARFSGLIANQGTNLLLSENEAVSPESFKTEMSFLESSKVKLSEFYNATAEVVGRSSKGFIQYADKTYGSLELRVEGIEKLRRDEFEALVPEGKNYYWWWSNQSLLIANLKQHPLIEDVKFESCEVGEPLRCFALKIKERVPTLWVKADWENNTETRFLIADDGAVLSILSTEKKMEAVSRFDRKLLARFSSEILTGLPVLDARNLANISDASQQLFKRAVRLVSIIENESNAEVYELRFLGDHEVEVEFDSQPFKVIFNIEANHALDSRIRAQILRLDKILSATPQISSRALSINLGLEKEAFAVLSKGDSKAKNGLAIMHSKKI